MSNAFNNNSRFASLIENKLATTNSANKKKDKKKSNNDNSQRRDDINSKEDPFEGNSDKKKNNDKPSGPKEKLVKIANPLSIEHFPEMINIKNPLITNHDINIDSIKNIRFSEKVKSRAHDKTKDINVDMDYQNLAPGWTVIKKAPDNGRIIMKTKETVKSTVPSENELALNVLDTLVELNNTRRTEYIEKWGYDLWEKMYRFPNYDYDYFDKLDELNYFSDEETDDTDGYAYDDDYY